MSSCRLGRATPTQDLSCVGGGASCPDAIALDDTFSACPIKPFLVPEIICQCRETDFGRRTNSSRRDLLERGFSERLKRRVENSPLGFLALLVAASRRRALPRQLVWLLFGVRH